MSASPQTVVVTGASSGVGRATARRWKPVPGDRGAHGIFDDQAHERSIQLGLATHHGLVALAAAGTAVAGIGAVAFRRRCRR